MLCRTHGCVSMIVPRSLLADLSSGGVRRLLWEVSDVRCVDAFPKDPPSCWVFPEAELAVSVFVANRKEHGGNIRVREHACRSIDSDASFQTVTLADAKLLDASILPIPIVGPGDIDIVRHIYAQPTTGRMKDYAPCSIGEVNSQYGASYFRESDTGTPLIRGRHVARYHLDLTARLGTEKRWFDSRQYLDDHAPTSRPWTRPRVVKQAITDINDPRRIICAPCPAGPFVLDSCDYLEPETPYSAEYVMAVLNSDVSEWRFRMTSSNNNVNTYEIDELPFPIIDEWNVSGRKAAADRAVTDVWAAVRTGDPHGAFAVVESALAEGMPRAAIHDAITAIVADLIASRSRVTETLHDFRLFLRSLPGGESLPTAFAEGGWLLLDEGEFFVELSERGLQLSTKRISTVRRERNDVESGLRNAISSAELADSAVSSMVSALLGLSGEQATHVRETMPTRPLYISN